MVQKSSYNENEYDKYGECLTLCLEAVSKGYTRHNKLNMSVYIMKICICITITSLTGKTQ